MLYIYSYCLPFATPFRSANLEIHERTGWILQLQKNEAIALSEYSPLPGFGRPDPEGVSIFNDKRHLKRFEEQVNRLVELPISELSEALDQEFSSPGITFAVSSLLVQYHSSNNKRPFHDLFFSDFPKPSSKIRVNDLWSLPTSSLSNQDTASESRQQVWTRIQKMKALGLTDIKMKSDSNFDRLRAILRFVSEWNQEMQDDVRLKLDFNHSLSYDDLKNLDAQLSNIEKSSIRYLEDPVRMYNLNDVSTLRACTTLPIAIDESFMHLITDNSPHVTEHIEILISELSSRAIDLIVVKPLLLGSLFTLGKLAKHCSQLNIELIISNLLESSIGRLWSLQLAKLFGSTRHSHGLWTGHLLQQDLFPDPIRLELSSQNPAQYTAVSFHTDHPNLTQVL